VALKTQQDTIQNAPETIFGASTIATIYASFERESIQNGGLVPVSVLTYISGLSRQRVSKLVSQERFQKFVYPFGVFLSWRQVAFFSCTARQNGRPKAISALAKKSVGLDMRGKRGAVQKTISAHLNGGLVRGSVNKTPKIRKTKCN